MKPIRKISLNCDTQRNIFFQRASHSLDSPNESFTLNPEQLEKYRQRFDPTSFVRDLNESDNINAELSKEKSTKSSLQNLIKQFGKKTHLWPRKRHESTCNISETMSPTNDPQDNFRARSKSLDVNYTNKILNDCDSTYKIFDKILREGNLRIFIDFPYIIFRL